MVLGASLELETPGAASVSAVGSDGLVGLEHQSTPLHQSIQVHYCTIAIVHLPTSTHRTPVH